MAEDLESQGGAIDAQSKNRLEATNREIRGEQGVEPGSSDARSEDRNAYTVGFVGIPPSGTNITRPSSAQAPVEGVENISSLDSRLAEIDKRLESEFDSSQPASNLGTQIFTGVHPEIEDAYQTNWKNIPHYDKFEGSAADDFYNSMMNAGMIRTAQGVANLIPTVASAVSDAEWAAGWMDTVNDWADRSEGYVSDMGNKSFFDTWDIRSLSAGLGQGVGSMLPMVGAAVATVGTGGIAGLVGGAGWAAGAASAGAYTNAATLAASTINIMPTIVEEGLQNGLTHQQASALSMSISPIIGLMEKIGLDEAVKAGIGVAGGSIKKEVIGEAMKSMSRKGMSSKNFQGTVKLAVGEIAQNYRAQISKELIKKGIPKGSSAYRKAMAKATGKGVGREIKLRGKDIALAGVKGSAAEAATESLQSLIETAGKQIYDLQFADEGATVGKGKFGADVMSREAWIQALEEGFYGGLIGGSFSTASRGFNGLRTETITSALDNAHKKGRLDEETERMLSVVENLRNDPEDKQSLRDIITTQSKVVKQMPKELTNPNARMQLFKLTHLARTLEGEIEESTIENALPGLEDITAAKSDQAKRRLKDVKRAINDIYSTTKELDKDGQPTGGRAINLDAVKEDGTKEYFITDITGVRPTGEVAVDETKTPDETLTEFEKQKKEDYEQTPEYFEKIAKDVFEGDIKDVKIKDITVVDPDTKEKKTITKKEQIEARYDAILDEISNSDMSVEDKIEASDRVFKINKRKCVYKS